VYLDAVNNASTLVRISSEFPAKVMTVAAQYGSGQLPHCAVYHGSVVHHVYGNSDAAATAVWTMTKGSLVDKCMSPFSIWVVADPLAVTTVVP
jgi:hypothetical protein